MDVRVPSTYTTNFLHRDGLLLWNSMVLNVLWVNSSVGLVGWFSMVLFLFALGEVPIFFGVHRWTCKQVPRFGVSDSGLTSTVESWWILISF